MTPGPEYGNSDRKNAAIKTLLAEEGAKRPSGETACSASDSSCRIQLARTVKQRDELAAMIERFAEDVDGQGDEIWARQLRLHVREIYSENANCAASGSERKNHE